MTEKTVKVKMDRSIAFATVHGEREPGSKHASVHFYQDGLPFDAQGVLVPEAIDPKDTKNLAKAEGKLKKAAAQQGKVSSTTSPSSGDGDDDDNGDDDNDREIGVAEVDELADVNLTSWAKGEQKVPWHLITKRIFDTYKKRVTNLEDALATLLDEKAVTLDELSPEYKKKIG